jgi:tetratricopeptide (TPR) repeat protein|tara:strand:+ start:4324 stop:4893 length:570 start_codon:yes stop_codon:yes gene_type:complete
VEKRSALKKTLFFICIMLFLQQTAWPQLISDSLYKVLKSATGENRVDVLNQISKIYEYRNPDSSLYYATGAETLASELDYKTGKALAIKNKGNYYVRTGNYTKAILEYDLAIDLYRSENDKEGLQTVINNKGNAYRVSGDYDQALYNFLESLKICEEEGFRQGIAYASLNIGIIYATRQGEKESNGQPG